MAADRVPRSGELWVARHTGTAVVVVEVTTDDDVVYQYRRSGNEHALTLLDFVGRYDWAAADALVAP